MPLLTNHNSNFLIALNAFLVLFALACSNSVQQKMKEEDYTRFYQNTSERLDEILIREASMNRMNSNWKSTYFLDHDSIGVSNFQDSVYSNKVPFLFVRNRTYQKVEEVDKNTSFVTLSSEDTSDVKIKKLDAIFNFTQEVYGYSHAYANEHFFKPDHVELYVNKQSLLYFSLGSNHEGSMSASIFNRENGSRVSGFGDNDFSGSYLRGNLVEGADSVQNVTLALMIGDSIYYEDFELEKEPLEID